MKKMIALLIAIAMLFTMAGTSLASSFDTKVKWGVNFRSEPNTNSYVYRMIPKGESIQVMEKINSYWLKVKVQDGTIGYISANSKYTNYSGAANQNQIITTGSPWLRSAPNVNNSKIYRSVPKGTTLTVLGKPNSYYVKVNYNGQTGYISTNYIKYTNGSSSSGSSSPSPSKSPSQIADSVIATAKSLIGKAKYDFGTRNPSKLIFDCSSFTQYVFAQHGIHFKWGTRYQKDEGTPVSKSNLKKGDLVFFKLNGTQIAHVGIYIGNGDFIHILSRDNGSDVYIANLNRGYWKDKYVSARRVIK